MIPLSNMTPEERERLCYIEGFTEAAALLGELDDATRAYDELEETKGDLLPVRYFMIDYENEDGPEVIEVSRFEFENENGPITYERHTVRENGVNQICLTRGLDQ